MDHPNKYRNKEVVILGLARSGRAVAKIFHAAGAAVIVNDRKERHLCPEADELEALGISVICGHHPPNLVHAKVSLLVKNPGVPYSAPPVVQALAQSIEVVTEVEVAYQFCKGRMIGITGSNGKTTTTTWIGQMLMAANLSPLIAGNIGKPLCEAALEAAPEQWMVIELSSFQLKGTTQFRPQISCLLNIYETHLDYHGSMEDYISSKSQLFRNQTAEDTAVINWDNDHCRKLLPEIKASVVLFSSKEELDTGVFVKRFSGDSEEWIIHKDQNGVENSLLKVNDLGIPGKHNLENALASAAVAITVGIEHSTIKRVLMSFNGVEHRLEYVRNFHNITFYNDSKSTNPSATIKALETFEENIILIAGGLDRGSDYKELEPWFKNKVKGLVTIGETKDKLNHLGKLAGISLLQSVDNDKNAAKSIQQAVNMAYSFAEEGDIILLSPACASWDMFESYEVRGRIFKESVHTLV